MTNLKNATIKEGILLEADSEQLFLTEGMEVKIVYYDFNDDEEKTTTGSITYTSECNLELEDNGVFISLGDIIEIEER